VADRPTTGLANLVAVAAMRGEAGGTSGEAGGAGTQGGEGGAGAAGTSDGSAGPPPLGAQIDQLESMSDAAVESVVATLLDPDADAPGGADPYSLLPTSYEAGSTTASARVVFVRQSTDGASGDDLPAPVVEGQLAIRDTVTAALGQDGGFAFGAGIVSEEAGQATGESFAIITPVALLLLLTILAVAYRDLLDVLLGFLGVILVLVWMGGFMGWTGIGVTQILIAVPFLLIGLSIDYALHVVMRYREADREVDESLDRGGSEGGDRGQEPTASEGRPSPRGAMRIGLGGVVVALAAATVTTSVGFLSNATSPIVSIREFGMVAAAGILSAFVVFAVFLPAVKVELEGLLRWAGLQRRKPPFGTGAIAGRVLRAGGTASRRAPVMLLALAVLLAAGGGVAATDIETSIDQVDFLPRDSPEWMDSLPEPFQPSDYALLDQATFLNDEFVQARGQSNAMILIEGDVTGPDTLERVATARTDLAKKTTPIRLASGELETADPVRTIRDVASENETVARVVAASDTDGDGIPDSNLTGVYDAVRGAAPARAGAVIHRADGEYRALRLAVAIQGGSDTATVASEFRAVATAIEAGGGLEATATGTPIVQQDVQQGLLRTLVQGFLLTLGVIAVFLGAIFWRRYGAPLLGPVVLFPVVCALAWILGTMYLVGIPFNSETAIIASIAIGIGVDYAIHIGERFLEERGRTDDPAVALDRTVLGTGGALLASAVSTASGFGVLMLALVPSLRRFGFVTSVAILYAFVASVVLLPGLLLLWDRWRGSAVIDDGEPTG
jgi:preprotein translocase subunit SecF